jgi:sulfite exporter TauE/SafE
MDKHVLDKVDVLLGKATSLLEGGLESDMNKVEKLLDKAQKAIDSNFVGVILGVTLPCGHSYSTKCYNKAYIEIILGGKPMLAKQNGEISTLIAEESVLGFGFPQNDNFKQYNGVVIQADQQWAELP